MARILSAGDVPGLPWHRVLRSDGRIAFPEGSEGFDEQVQRLRAEGVRVEAGRVRGQRAAPTLDEVESTLLEHVQALHEFYGEVMGVRIARKHAGWYLATLPGARDFRARFNHLEDRDAQAFSIQQFFALNHAEFCT